MRSLMLPTPTPVRRKSARPVRKVTASTKSGKAATPAPKKPARKELARKELARRAGTQPAPRRGRRRGQWLPARYRGRAGSRRYFVYVPAGVRRTKGVPLLVALHGCAQNAEQFAATTRFNDLADRHGFVVVYPEQTARTHPQRCWHWYESGHQQRDAGEPAIIVGITDEVTAAQSRWSIDPDRVYVAGLSAGGAMALVLAATYPDRFAAVGVHSAPAYRSASSGRHAMGALAGRAVAPPPVVTGRLSAPMPPTILFQGTGDSTVRGRNGDQVVEQWLAFCRAHTTNPNDRDRITRNRTSSGHTSDGRRYTTSRWYSARGRTMLEYWQVSGLSHAWSGGAAGAYSDPRGPRASTAMWRFFSARRLPPAG
jgi:poly(hydroxyalkanoate) depolymerase family esterase